MIYGYKDLSENITQTMNLISDIENASKEQLIITLMHGSVVIHLQFKQLFGLEMIILYL